jgi:hypothetical protein
VHDLQTSAKALRTNTMMMMITSDIRLRIIDDTEIDSCLGWFVKPGEDLIDD